MTERSLQAQSALRRSTREPMLRTMFEGKSLSISQVLHKAFVDVNEQGTEAAAATAVMMEVTGVPPPPQVFRADRPFVILIRDNTSGSILFIGRVVNPTL